MEPLLAYWRTHVNGVPRRRDLVDAVSVGLTGTVLVWIGVGPLITDAPWEFPSPWWHLVPLAVGCLVMLAKRRRPMLALGCGALVAAVDFSFGGGFGIVLVLLDLIYSAAVYASRRNVRALTTVLSVVIAVCGALAWALTKDVRFGVFALLQAFAIMGTPLWWGTSVRQQAELAALARSRADDLHHLADLRQAERLRHERSRMAGDLHDAIAGDLSAMAIHSEAALARADGSADRQALRLVREASLRSLAEMRSMIDLLRSGEEVDTAPARLSDLDERTRLATQYGTDVTLPACASGPWPAATDHAAYRIVQESLANAAKHGDGAPPTVRIGVEPDWLRIEVRNAVGGGSAVPHVNGGHGLEIMRERALALGGGFDAAAEDDRWIVRAALPISSAGGGSDR